MKNYVSFILLMCFAFLLADCKKHQDLPVYVMDSDTMIDKHFDFKAGSYWIYKDSLNGRIDSFYVSSNYITKQGTENAIYVFHYIVIRDVSETAAFIADSSRWVFDFRAYDMWAGYSYGRNGYGWASTITYSPLFHYPFSVGDIYSSFDTVNVTQVDSFLAINGLPYYNVAKVHQHINVGVTSSDITRMDDWFFVNDSVGLVKMKIWHPLDNISHIWELQRYNIVK